LELHLTDVQNLLDELNGRLTAVTIQYPGSEPFIESFQKHVRFALHNPEKARIGKLLKKGRRWLHENSWKHPIFRDDFQKMVSRIDEFEGKNEPGEAAS